MNDIRELAERVFVSYLRDMLRPHNIHNPFSQAIHRHTANNGKVYYHPRNQRNKIEAERFFTAHNQELQWWCDQLNIEKPDILQIVNYCVAHNKDRLYGKRAMRAYFKQKGL